MANEHTTPKIEQTNGEQGLKREEGLDAINASGSSENSDPAAPIHPEAARPLSPEAQLEQLQQELKQTKERMLRIAADFENFRRRARRDVDDAGKTAENSVVVEFLNIADNLERAMEHGEAIGAATTEGTLFEGLKMVRKQFLSSLARYDIEPLEVIGKPFDPAWHEAIQREHSELPRNTIVRELRRGYRRGERLVRPALVIVSDGPATAAPEHSSSSTAN